MHFFQHFHNSRSLRRCKTTELSNTQKKHVSKRINRTTNPCGSHFSAVASDIVPLDCMRQYMNMQNCCRHDSTPATHRLSATTPVVVKHTHDITFPYHVHTLDMVFVAAACLQIQQTPYIRRRRIMSHSANAKAISCSALKAQLHCWRCSVAACRELCQDIRVYNMQFTELLGRGLVTSSQRVFAFALSLATCGCYVLDLNAMPELCANTHTNSRMCAGVRSCFWQPHFEVSRLSKSIRYTTALCHHLHGTMRRLYGYSIPPKHVAQCTLWNCAALCRDGLCSSVSLVCVCDNLI